MCYYCVVVLRIFVAYHDIDKVIEYECEGREKTLAQNIATKNPKAASKAAIGVLRSTFQQSIERSNFIYRVNIAY